MLQTFIKLCVSSLLFTLLCLVIAFAVYAALLPTTFGSIVITAQAVDAFVGIATIGATASLVYSGVSTLLQHKVGDLVSSFTNLA